ncbi:MAG TPA: hypothetical protein VKB80_06085 [Kofleriaceae bacterium]|nr:hypothetical protein [Kofleriaceae bacterium]
MKPAELLDHLWRHGVSADDRDALAAARDAVAGRAAAGRAIDPHDPHDAAADDDAEPIDPDVALGLQLFAGWLAAGDADGDASAGLDPEAMPDAELAVLAHAMALRRANRRRDLAAIDAGLAAVDEEMGSLDPGDPRGATARAAVDLALADAALLGGDVTAARRCLTRVAASGPPAFRIAALLHQVILLVARDDLPTALTRARQAERLADQLGRPVQGQRAQLLLGLVGYAMGDADAMRTALAPLASGPDAATARVIIAGLDEPDQVPAAASAGIQISSERRDPLGYALCSLVGGRCHARRGRPVDALVLALPARLHVGGVAPELAVALDGEIEAWRRAWGDEAFRAAEREALAALERR